jgi:hypothetical protein
MQAIHDPDTGAHTLDRLALTVPEAANLLGLGRSAAYEQARRYIATGGREGLPCLRLGRRLIVPSAPLRSILGLAASQSGAGLSDAPDQEGVTAGGGGLRR